MADLGTNHARGMRSSLTGMLTNGGLATIKLLAGILGHSYALIADAVESMADIVGSMVVWGGLRVSAMPADAEHPYGHGKAEPIAAFTVSLMLWAAGLGIALKALFDILGGERHAPAAFTLLVLAVVVAVKEGLFRFVRRVAVEVDSGAVLADAWHHRSDAITSAAAAIGISIALIGGRGYESADDWAAMFASVIIVYNGWRLVKRPFHELMDAVPVEVTNQARTAARAVPGVAGVEKVLARKAGMKYLVDMHLEVDPTMPVVRAHALAHDVKENIRACMPNVQDVLIHIEPCDGHPGARLEPEHIKELEHESEAHSDDRR